MEEDPELIETIAEDVLKVLASRGFFEMLDDSLCPADAPQASSLCSGTLAISTAVLAENGFDPDEVSEIVAVLRSRGGHCDCEILFNVADHSRLKSRYWLSRAAHHRA
jgi:hypothetical protein